MNTVIDQGAIAPEVQEFLTAVRAQLADLDPDEQREILDGLEADLTDLVAERGGEALGDPVAYASELRAAAGLDPEMPKPKGRPGLGQRFTKGLDACHASADRVVESLPGDAGPLLHWLRPVWWIARAWAALELVDLVFGRGRYAGDLEVVPHLRGYGWVLLLLAIGASVQLGRGAFWPGGSRGAAARSTLVLLNAFAMLMIPLALIQIGSSASDNGYGRGWSQGYQAAMSEARASSGPKAGMYVDGKWVSNIYPYDAQGRPLVGVQLFNQIGQPINVMTQSDHESCDATGPNCPEGFPVDNEGNQLLRVFYPWTNGATQLFNVFPIPSRLQDSGDLSPTAFTDKVRPRIDPYPQASVAKVSLPGIKTGRQPVAVAPSAGSATTPAS